MNRLEFIEGKGDLLDRLHPKNYFNDYKVGNKVKIKSYEEYPKPFFNNSWSTLTDMGSFSKEFYRDQIHIIEEVKEDRYVETQLLKLKGIIWWWKSYEVVKVDK